MTVERKLILTPSTIFFPALFLLLMWGAYWAELRFGIRLRNYGIRPHDWVGLRGIVFGPFLHGNLSHLASNSLPVFLLSLGLFYFYREIAWPVLLWGTLLTGLLTWLIGSYGTNHIGASGVVYLLFSFLFFKGIWSKNFRLIALSLIVVFVYGSLVWGVLPGKPQISWEGHLSGFLSGILLAVIYRKYQIEGQMVKVENPIVSKRDAEFLSHFDENGNFVPYSEWVRCREEALEDEIRTPSDDVRVKYIYKPDKEQE